MLSLPALSGVEGKYVGKPPHTLRQALGGDTRFWELKISFFSLAELLYFLLSRREVEIHRTLIAVYFFLFQKHNPIYQKHLLFPYNLW